MTAPNTQEPNSPQSDNSRRKLIKAALVTSPVLMSLTSRPVNAIQGLSNMLSGNTSVCNGDNFYGGMSPGGWKGPQGTTDLGHTFGTAWGMTGYEYGTLKSGGNQNKYEDYEGGTLFSKVFTDVGDPYPGKSLREVLNENEDDMTTRGKWFHIIAGLLNAKYFEHANANGNYFMSSADFWDIYYGNTSKIPVGFANLGDLISGGTSNAHYHRVPGDTCK